MKTTIHLFIASLLLPFGSSALHASSLGKTIEAHTALQAVDVSLPEYPQRMLAAGVPSGRTDIILEIAPDGSITDQFVIASTHMAFSQATERAVQSWVFKPDTSKGTPIIHVIRLRLQFRTEGVVAVVTQPDIVRGDSRRNRVAPCAVHKLDAPLQLQESTMPRIPATEDGKPATGSVVISYYVDQTGTVRVPTAEEGEPPELAAAAAQAVKNWRFTPPTANGEAVFVQVRQRFNFDNG